MDFLDPQAKRRHIIRLVIGYGLMIVLIGLATFILLFQAYGFDVDRKTGQVIQNGLVFVDSAPDNGAVIFNNDEQKNRTNNRFALPAGQYDLQIKKDGYRDWRRSFALNGGEVERFTYPLLLPNKLNSRQIQAYEQIPTFVTESPDRRWAVVNQGSSLTNFTEYDMNSLENNVPRSRAFSVPAGVFSAAAGDHAIELVEWSNDNKNFLVKHTYEGGSEFVMLSRDQPETSVNINKFLGQNPTKITLRDKKFDQWYLYNEVDGTLQLADAKKSVAPLLKGVTAYKTHDDDTILYSERMPDGKSQRVLIRQGDETYTVKEVVSSTVLLEIAKYNGDWYIVIGADGEQKTYIYREPVATLQKRDGTKPTPTAVQKTSGPMTHVSFSQNTRFISTQSGQHFEIYDTEYNQSYRYDVPSPIDGGAKAVWMDGHRLLVRSQNKAFTFDFDGSNNQELVSSLPHSPLLFDRDYEIIYSVNNSTNPAGKTAFFGTDLKLEADK